MEDTEKIRVGTCAWSFDDWHGPFYPEHLPATERLGFYARYFDSVEIDSTFYAAPTPQTAGHWLDVTPDHFVFSAKMTREITHDRKLRDCAELLERFLAALAPLHRKLACVLVQLPPYFTLKHDETALREFILNLPRDFRFAIEFRDASWHLPRIAHLLEEHHVCWVWNDTTPLDRAHEGAFQFLPRTTDFLYVRLLGDPTTKYASDGSRLHNYRGLGWPRDASLDSWTVRIRQALPDVRQALIYTNNHVEGFSPHTAQRIAARLGGKICLPSPGDLVNAEDQDQLALF